MLHIFSGEVDLGPIGIETNIPCENADKLYTGDVVLVQKYDKFIGYTCEFPEVSAVVGDYLDGSDPFVMGIKDVTYSDLNDGEWSEGWVVHKIKLYKDLIAGECLGNYGLNIREVNT